MGIASESISRPGRRRQRPLGAHLVDVVQRGTGALRRRRALDTATREFAAVHPYWAASAFDAAFLRRPDAEAAVRARDANGLARAWTHQFRYADERRRERDVARLAGVASAFLALLDAPALRDGARRSSRDPAQR